MRFEWNGKHAGDFVDANQEFRRAVRQAALGDPSAFPLELFRHLAAEEAEWSREAWCAPEDFPELLAALLRRGGREAIRDFAAAANFTFDTFGAAHEVRLTRDEADEYLDAARELLNSETDEQARAALKSTVELLEKLRDGNAADGWVAVQ